MRSPAPGAPPAGALVVVAAPGALLDERTAREVAQRAGAQAGVDVELRVATSAAHLAEVVADVVAAGGAAGGGAAGGEFVLVCAEPGALAQQPAVAGALARALPAGRSLVRVDLGPAPLDHSPGVRCHVRGRGLAGVRYAVQAWATHRAWPASVHRYGPHPEQWAGLRLPRAPRAAAPQHGAPVAVLLHGGYWRSRWGADLMDPLAVDLAQRGYAAWNVEYRRPDEHGWAATTNDVAAAVQALAAVAAVEGSTGAEGSAGAGGLAGGDAPVALDLTRVVVLGHSAGGQLAVRLAADLAGGLPDDAAARVRPALTVSLAGVLDLHTADARWMSEGAVAGALGGRAHEVPAEYGRSSPLARLPVGLPLAAVTPTDDDADLVDIGRAFTRAAIAAGDRLDVVEEGGDHFSVIDPGAPIWGAVVDVVERVCGRG